MPIMPEQSEYQKALSALEAFRLRAKLYGLIAKPEFWGISIDDLFELVGNGRCGPGHGVVEWLVPDNILSANVTPACTIHDFDYATGQTDEDKMVADCRLLVNLQLIIDINFEPGIFRKISYDIAEIYYNEVRDHGHDAFWAGKDPEEWKRSSSGS